MGELIVDSGGYAEVIDVYSNAYLYVSDNGSADTINIYDGGSVIIGEDGSCSLVNISNGGTLNLYESAIVNDVNIYPGGLAEIDCSTTASDVKESGGRLVYDSDADVYITEQTVASGLTIDNSERTATVHSGTTFFNANIQPSARISVYSSGCVSLMNVYGSADINSGACVKTMRVIGSEAYVTFSSGAIIPTSGSIWVYSGGYASGYQPVQINSGVVVQVSIEPRDDWGDDARSGSVYNFAVNPHGSFIIASGGYADDIIENGGYVELQAGATCYFTPNTMSVSLAGDPRTNTMDICTVHSGTTLSRATLTNNAAIFIFSGGIASNVSLCTSTCGIWWVDTNTDDYRENGDYAQATSVVYGSPGVYKVLANGTISRTGNV